MTYSELIDVVRCLFPAILEKAQFETCRSGIDADDLDWVIKTSSPIWRYTGFHGIDIMAWPYGHGGVNNTRRIMAFRALIPLV